jgi:hypothetical protein
VKTRTPSVNVLAARVLLSRLQMMTPAEGELSVHYKTRISKEKRDKIVAQVAKIRRPLENRLKRIIDKFEAGTAPTKENTV